MEATLILCCILLLASNKCGSNISYFVSKLEFLCTKIGAHVRDELANFRLVQLMICSLATKLIGEQKCLRLYDNLRTSIRVGDCCLDDYDVIWN